MVLAAVGLPYDDYAGGPSPVTPKLLGVLTYNTGVNANDTSFKTSFPYVQTPWAGTCNCAGLEVNYTQPPILPPSSRLGIMAREVFVSSAPNPFNNTTTIRYRMDEPGHISIEVFDGRGNQVNVLVNQQQQAGTYTVYWNASRLPAGVYLVKALKNGEVKQTMRLVKQ